MSNKNSAAVGCFRYAQFVFVAEIFLAIYWICVLTYASINDHEKLLAGIIFGLHYAGLIALSGLLDELTKKKNAVIRYVKKAPSWYQKTSPYRKSVPIRGKIAISLGGARHDRGITSNESREFFETTSDPVNEENLKESLNNYPLSYGVALFVAMISDLFSLVDAILEHENNEIGVVTYYLYVVLFALGLCLTVSSIVWSMIFYFQMRSLTTEKRNAPDDDRRDELL